MVLKTFNPNGSGTIVLDDDAGDDDISRVLLLDATEPDINNGKVARRTEILLDYLVKKNMR